MAASLTVIAIEKSTFVVVASFKDEEDNDVAPDTLKWTLTDVEGNVINGKDQVEIASPDTSNNIVLKGDDLQTAGTAGTQKRVVTVEATYTSTLGVGLPLTGAVEFDLENLIAM